ncbi:MULTISPECIES: energy transducer TonB [unclassified Candidatus Frackibacter]|uniref:energy transducer TonB n=1 Tax=unclassified Candidatus Frackibacter TaxID=2648818 RepID=UPI00088F0051|nr:MULTISPECIES: energy transducer TonB [unclassified Candidatus Frackibacter]SDC51158.1 TonB family C-terminal domain-containing protein [Candidatus Frackibacter sp. WG11]SEM40721.1 TonB family C-terminal domain-containing protein [Candidatus Frackibacter sp. WG12]SFL75210.1 TonB family C-terminal domain-containing protein [Candidatus Frackibacter sp. WG13]
MKRYILISLLIHILILAFFPSVYQAKPGFKVSPLEQPGVIRYVELEKNDPNVIKKIDSKDSTKKNKKHENDKKEEEKEEKKKQKEEKKQEKQEKQEEKAKTSNKKEPKEKTNIDEQKVAKQEDVNQNESKLEKNNSKSKTSSDVLDSQKGKETIEVSKDKVNKQRETNDKADSNRNKSESKNQQSNTEKADNKSGQANNKDTDDNSKEESKPQKKTPQMMVAKKLVPVYPKNAANQNVEGTVKLRVDVSATGKIMDIRILKSSGNSSLDGVAKLTVERGWNFHTAINSYSVFLTINFQAGENVKVQFNKLDL